MKPILTAATLLLKATGTYKEGELSWSAGYLYISFVYNISICVRYVGVEVLKGQAEPRTDPPDAMPPAIDIF